MAELTLSPERNSYSIASGNSVYSVPLEGGFSRDRQQTTDSIYRVSVSWIPANSVAYNYLVNFYETTTKRGTLPFTMKLITDRAELADHDCKFVANSFTRGTLYAGQYMGCSAVLEVKPVDPSAVTTEDGTEFWFNQHYYRDTGQGASEMCDVIQNVISAL
jgi:hypothetical protein